MPRPLLFSIMFVVFCDTTAVPGDECIGEYRLLSTLIKIGLANKSRCGYHIYDTMSTRAN